MMFFKLRAPRRFHHRPIYFDEKREWLKERRGATLEQESFSIMSSTENEAYTTRPLGGRRTFRKHPAQKVYYRLVVLLLVLMVLVASFLC